MISAYFVNMHTMLLVAQNAGGATDNTLRRLTTNSADDSWQDVYWFTVFVVTFLTTLRLELFVLELFAYMWKLFLFDYTAVVGNRYF